MKKKIFRYLAPFAEKIPLHWLINITSQRLFCPVYHIVNDQIRSHVKQLYPVRSINQFKQDLDYMLKHFTPVNLEQLKSILQHPNPPDKNYLFLSFDDGFRECYDIIAPILKRKGIPATFFLNSDFIDNKKLFFRCKASLLIEKVEVDKKLFHNKLKEIQKCLKNTQVNYNNFRKFVLSISYEQQEILDQLAKLLNLDFNDYLYQQRPYMSQDQVHELLKDGFSIGAHSLDHPDYRHLSLKEQLNQTIASIDKLKKSFNTQHTAFSFPFTDDGVSKDFFKQLQSKINSDVITFGCAGLKKETISFHQQRFIMDDQPLSSQKLINSEYLYYILKAPLFKNTIKRN